MKPSKNVIILINAKVNEKCNLALINKFMLKSSDFKRISDIEFQATEANSRLDQTRAQHKVTRVSLVEEKDIMSLMRPNILKVCAVMWSTWL